MSGGSNFLKSFFECFFIWREYWHVLVIFRMSIEWMCFVNVAGDEYFEIVAYDLRCVCLHELHSSMNL